MEGSLGDAEIRGVVTGSAAGAMSGGRHSWGFGFFTGGGGWRGSIDGAKRGAKPAGGAVAVRAHALAGAIRERGVLPRIACRDWLTQPAESQPRSISNP